MIEFETKSFTDFGDWLKKLPRNSSHPYSAAREGRLLYFDKDRRNNVLYSVEGVYFFQGTQDIPLICLAKIEQPPASYKTPDDLWLCILRLTPLFESKGWVLPL